MLNEVRTPAREELNRLSQKQRENKMPGKFESLDDAWIDLINSSTEKNARFSKDCFYAGAFGMLLLIDQIGSDRAKEKTKTDYIKHIMETLRK